MQSSSQMITTNKATSSATDIYIYFYNYINTKNLHLYCSLAVPNIVIHLA